MASGKLEGLITVPTGGWSADLVEGGAPAGSITIPAGTYYWATFLAAFKVTLDAIGAETYTLTLNSAEAEDGKLTIAATGAFELEIDDTALFDLIGFSGDLTPSAASHEGDEHVRNLWIAKGAQQRPRPAGDSGLYETNVRTMSNASGKVWTLGGTTRRVLPLAWDGVPVARTLVAKEDTVNESFERWWLDNVVGDCAWTTVGNQFRFFWDADVSGTYEDYKVEGEALTQLPVTQMHQHYLGVWRIAFDRLVAVPS